MIELSIVARCTAQCNIIAVIIVFRRLLYARYCAACAKELVLKPVIQLPKPLWREILELMGGEYAECSRRAYSDSYLDLDQKDQQ